MTEKTNIISFRGDLGAGKTTLIKNICNFLGVKDEVTSPTFSIVNEYETHNKKTIYHFDFYRLESEEEAFDMGIEDYFYSTKLCLMEWPSKIEGLLPNDRIEVSISIVGNKREFTINHVV
ncbi:MAG: tRNA (adenosine(37)-N6)-threonylcarbamoyltransferase complex ATPase subunit type 1 TsaE [Flavobacteriales bacterium]|nr:tRNA (adenosine(37)-N6)-threonylcarbamoyltransferase complex ATPase subunit type 1 TsaE [Flavobacteriales bacterium]